MENIEQHKSDLDYLKQACEFMRSAGFDSALVIATKYSDGNTVRFDWQVGNYYASLKCAEIFVQEQYAPEEEDE